jgi:tetratricopeptide (TPR) repeat protein
MRLSNKKIKYIKRHALKKSPKDMARDLRIPVKVVKKALKQFESLQSQDGVSAFQSEKAIDIPHQFHLISSFFICVLCIIIYSNTLNAPFIFDDLPNIENNSFVRLTQLDFKKIYEAGIKSPSHNRPLANISFALNHYFWGNNVTSYHIVNIIIHLLNGILVYFLAFIIFKQAFSLPNPKNLQPLSSTLHLMSLLSALIFVSHPLQTQSVTYIVQRMNSMASMFFLLSLLLYIHGRLEQTNWRRWSMYCVSFFSWILALVSKEIAATFPFIIFVYEWYFFQNLSMVWLKKNIKYLLGLLAFLGLITFIFLGANPIEKIGHFYDYRDFTLSQRVLTQFRVVVFYASLLLFPLPSRLNLIHHIQTSNSLLDPITTLFSVLILFGLIALAIYIARSQRLLSFCILWFFINLVIESSVIPLELIYEHRLYLPLVGLALIASYLLFGLYSKRSLWIIGISLVLIIALGTGTFIRNRVYKNPMTLWSDVLSKNPQSHRAHNNLGVELHSRGRIREAFGHHSKALEINPENAEAYYNLGIIYTMQGKYDEAIKNYSETLRIKPRHPEAHCNLGVAMLNQGRAEEAIVHFSEALRQKPHYLVAHNSYGVALARQGKFQQAVDHFNEALRLKPDYSAARENLELALIQMRKSSGKQEKSSRP